MNTEINVSLHCEFDNYLDEVAEELLGQLGPSEFYEKAVLDFNEMLNGALASDNLDWHEEVAESFIGDKPILDKLREWGLQFPNDFYK